MKTNALRGGLQDRPLGSGGAGSRKLCDFVEVLPCPQGAPGVHPGAGAHSSPGSAPSLCSLLGTEDVNLLPRGPGRCHSCSLHLNPGNQSQFLNRSGQRQTGELSKNLLENHGSWWVSLSMSFYYKLLVYFRVKEGNSYPDFYCLVLLERASLVSHKTSAAWRSAAWVLWVRTTLWDEINRRLWRGYSSSKFQARGVVPMALVLQGWLAGEEEQQSIGLVVANVWVELKQWRRSHGGHI